MNFLRKTYSICVILFLNQIYLLNGQQFELIVKNKTNDEINENNYDQDDSSIKIFRKFNSVHMNSNFINLNNSNFKTSSSTTTYNWPVLAISLFSLFGILGNMLVCMTIRRDHTLQTKTNYYLFSLAIADLAVCSIVIPLSIVQDFLDAWVFNSFLCIFWIFSDILYSTCSIYHLSAVSILRFIAIQFPLKSNRTTSTQLTYFILFIIWSISILISSAIIYLGLVDISNIMSADRKCYLRNLNFILYGSIFAFVIPLFIMILMFSLMVRKLRRQMSKLDNCSITSTTSKKYSDYDIKLNPPPPPPPSTTTRINMSSSNLNSTNNSCNLNGSTRYRHHHSRDYLDKKIKSKKKLIFFRTSRKNNKSRTLREEQSSSITNSEYLNNKDSVISENNTLNVVNNSNCNRMINAMNVNHMNESIRINKQRENQQQQQHQLRRHAARSIIQRPSFKNSITSIGSSTILSRKGTRLVNSKNFSTDLSNYYRHSNSNSTISNGTTQKLNIIYKARSYEFKNSFLGNASNIEIKNEVKALKVLGIVFIAFIIAWLPYCLINIGSAICFIYKIETINIHNYLGYFTYLGYFSSTFNPIIYTAFNKKFRRNFLEILKCTKRRRKLTRYKINNFS